MSKLYLSVTVDLPADVFEAARVVSALDDGWKDFVSRITSKHEVTVKHQPERVASPSGNGAGHEAKRKRRTKAEMEAARQVALQGAEAAKVF